MKKVFGIGIIIVILGGLFFSWGIFLSVNKKDSKESIFVVEKGQGSKDIALNLEKEGLIRWGSLFRVYALVTGTSKKLQAGVYELSTSMNIPQMVEKFATGDIIKVVLTVPEGFILEQIQEKLSRIFNGTRTVLVPLVEEYKKEFQFLEDAPANATLEGYLFPDTYQSSYNTSAEEIIRKMLENFDRKLSQDLRKEISRQKKTIFEIITMASMIEKEVKTKEDKELVSGILWKRLERGIPLQIDATISYITGKQTTNPAGPSTQCVECSAYGVKISKEETQIDSPYNTYKYRGLPIGPISNPGLESILAAIYPKSSQHWYYLSTPEGETIFSRTLEEHNRAKAKYLR